MMLAASLRKVTQLGFILSLISTLALTGCGGGGSSSSGGTPSPTAATTISGTAATGMPITGNVVAIDATGNTFSATTVATGAYTVNVAGGTAPFILTVVGTSGGKTVYLTSVATAPGQTVNITPLTDLIVSTAAGQPSGQTLVNLCIPTVQAGCNAALTAATSGANLNVAVTAVKNMIAPLNGANADPLNGTFVGGSGMGMDALLDQILVTPASVQGAMATVTLIAVPSQQLGTVTMPNAAGGVASAVTVTPTGTNLTLATTGATALSEIQACMASLSALYPANMTTPPTSAQVSPFIDPTFLMQSKTSSQFITKLTTLQSAGGIAAPNIFANLGLTFGALSSMDYSPQSSAAAINPLSSPIAVNASGVPIYAWVHIGGNDNWKFIKGASYSGCPGGWTIAGDQHLSQHMDARVNKSIGGSTPSYNRQLAVHADTPQALALGVGSIVISGPGLAGYSGKTAAPVGASISITLLPPPVPVAPAVQDPTYVMQGQVNVSTGATTGYYGYAEAINSCQDLAATTAPQGTPCYDEGAVAPGAVFIWTVYNTAATPTVIYAFPFQVNAVPLSSAFVAANDSHLFASLVTVPTVTAMNTEIASLTTGALVPDNFITYSYTLSNVYGATGNNCGIGLNTSANIQIFYAEEDNAATTSTCSFTTAGVGQGSLATPNPTAVAANGYYYVTVSVLGVSAQVNGPLAP
jgi:hypothetical protein